MRVIINRISFRDIMDLPMEERFGVFVDRDHMRPGYVLGTVPGDMDYAWTQEYSLEEYLLCAMYEGGEFCGLCWSHDDDDRIEFTWALMPETPKDLEHIENVILPYGRANRFRKMKEEADG